MIDTIKHPIWLSPAAKLNLLDAAIYYLERHISVLPLWGKKPALWSWTETQHTRVSVEHPGVWAEDGLLRNVGIVLGDVSENLVVIDLDGEQAVDEFWRAFPGLFETYVVLSGSGKGKHLYWYVDELPATTRTKGLELRSTGTYVVAPPSRHPDTQMVYVPVTERPVGRRMNMLDVIEWIKNRTPKAPMPAAPALPAAEPAFVTDMYQANGRKYYFNRALEGEINRVVRSTPGTRNNNLNTAAFCMGGLVLTALDYSQAETALLDAALSVGTPEIEARRTLKSGLTAGMRKPRPYPGAR